MSASWVRTLKGMMDRGTGDLTTVDNALRKKVITQAEADDCYAYWYTLHPEPTPEPEPEPAAEPETGTGDGQ